ncbi:MAG: MFS transporter [Bacteroidetes bacterium HGW-Bacteroidetes-4]|nr:MAG: MFS transporter [Bacteroidetes bacterium HGW-Bacteroidetes-4]
MSSNIYKLYLIKIAKWFMLIMPIVVLFYNENGLEQFDIFLLQGIYSVAIVVLEIPSGYFADVLGRKKTLIAGSILGFLGYVVYSFSYGFAGFLIAEIVLGIGTSLISGADSAMLYDTLLDEKREKQYLKFEGRIISIGNFAEAIAGIAGGFLATYSLRHPYYFQAAVAFLAIPAALTLREPSRHKALVKASFNDIVDIFRYTLFGNKALRLNIVYSAVIGSATLSMAWFVQPFFKEVQVPIAAFGILWTLLNLSVGITSMFAHRLEKKLGSIKSVFFITLFISGMYLLTGYIQSIWGIGFLFVFYLVRGYATPVLKDYINRLTESNIRATVLSVRNFIIRLVFAGLGPLLGYFTDHYSLSFALKTAGIIYLILGIMATLLFIKVLRTN